MHPRDNTSTPREHAARLWRASHMIGVACAAGALAACNVGLSGKEQLGPQSVPVDVLERAEAGMTAAQEFPDHIVPSDRDLSDPTEVVAMTVRLYAGEQPMVPSSPNHIVDYEPYSLRLIQISAAPGSEVEASELEESLSASEDIDANHESIRSLSRSITSGARGDRAKVRRLIRWVYANMRYQKAHMPRASDVLAVRTGDCTEYSHLFIALARAAKLPARRVVGLAYTEYRGRPAFGYHAWAEVAIDGRWVPVDPTWNETLADATHIKLSEGVSDRWRDSIGLVEIEVLEVRRNVLATLDRSRPRSIDRTR